MKVLKLNKLHYETIGRRKKKDFMKFCERYLFCVLQCD